MDLSGLVLPREVLLGPVLGTEAGEVDEGPKALAASHQLDARRPRSCVLVAAVLGLLCGTLLVCGCGSRTGRSSAATDAQPPETPCSISSAAVSPDGKQVAISVSHYTGDRFASAGLWVVDTVDGSATVVLESPSVELRSPSWSADSKRVAVTCNSGGGSGIKVLNMERLQLLDVVGPAEGRFCLGPRMSPDGRKVAYVRISDGTPTVCVADADGLAPPIDLVRGKTFDGIDPMSLSWSTDRRLLYYLSSRDGLVCAVDVAAGEVATVGTLPAKGFSGRVVPSPDGRWLLCTVWASEGDGDGVWLMSAGSGEVTVLPSASPRPNAAWSPTGSQVVWEEAASQKESGLFVCDVSTGRSTHVAGTGEQDEVAAQHAWTEDGRVFFVRDRRAVMVVAARGGARETEVWSASAAVRRQ